jgi:hypothetical protein
MARAMARIMINGMAIQPKNKQRNKNVTEYLNRLEINSPIVVIVKS